MNDIWENHNTVVKRNLFYKTKLWHKRKKFMLEKFDLTCQECGSKDKRLEMHHLRYNEDLGYDKPKDLTVVCHSCHEKLHGRKLYYSPRRYYTRGSC